MIDRCHHGNSSLKYLLVIVTVLLRRMKAADWLLDEFQHVFIFMSGSHGENLSSSIVFSVFDCLSSTRHRRRVT